MWMNTRKPFQDAEIPYMRITGMVSTIEVDDSASLVGQVDKHRMRFLAGTRGKSMQGRCKS
jgi:hypothetical protein